MTQRQLLDTALKITSLYFLVRAIAAFKDISLYLLMGMGENLFEGWGMNLFLGGMFVDGITNILIFWIFAFKSDSVINILKIGDEKKAEEMSFLGLKKVDWLEIAIVIVGVFAVIAAFPELLYKIADSIYFKRQPSAFINDKDPRPEVLFSLFKLIIGLIVILNARQISKGIIKRGEKDDRLDSVNESQISQGSNKE